MSHVVDDLELYAVGALPDADADRVARHLAACATCRAAAADLDHVVALLPDAVPLVEPPPGLRARILEAARAGSADRTRAAWRSWLAGWPIPRLAFAAMAAAVLVLAAVDLQQASALRAVQAEHAQYGPFVADFAYGGKTWYMAGVGDWRGVGGNLMQPANGDPAFALFHDLRDLPDGQMYALWMISPDGKWTRAANFRPDGNELQTVTLAVSASELDWCAVTIETSAEGKHAGPVIMESARGTS